MLQFSGTTSVHRNSSESGYFHGYSLDEQQRLIRQAEYWRRTLIPVGLSYQAGDRVLEIGCGAGATLAVLATEFPRINVAGIDIEPRQIEFASGLLAAQGIPADLRVGDARHLPWDDGSFDHVYVMWMIEHIRDAAAILREAQRVLRSGGTIAVTETDYTTFKVTPLSVDWDHVEQAQFEHFARYGNPIAGRQLGVLLSQAGFKQVRNGPVGFHFFSDGTERLRNHVNYVLEFLAPGVAQMASLGFDEVRLRKGLAHLRSIPDLTDGSMTQIIYRTHAVVE
jgi:ubiquinone/menaquinone biosynthesis C-methylase UbiE